MAQIVPGIATVTFTSTEAREILFSDKVFTHEMFECSLSDPL